MALLKCGECAMWVARSATGEGSCYLNPPNAVMAGSVNPLTGQPQPIVLSFRPETKHDDFCNSGVFIENAVN